MVNATLCTTDGKKPWAANVDFENSGVIWTTRLKTKYKHFQNLLISKNAVIVYKADGFEVIIEAVAEILGGPEFGQVEVKFNLVWLRLVADGEVQDFKEESEISQVLETKLIV